jgi:selenocysteine-specific elongation factor
MRVIGTAGHVDHGKSTLIAALTGTHPDRLKEEQAREMTIELGFGWLTLPNGEDVGIVDVPGHRDFIENMLAGIGGIDAALLVIAADEGVMPQTREHLAILDLLQIPAGLIVLTKIDLAPDITSGGGSTWLDLVETDIRTAVQNTVLQDAPIIRISAKTKIGLASLILSLQSLLEKKSPRPDLNRPRLPVDRTFSMSGFGTVVTGTLSDGHFTVGDEIEIMPSGLRGRIRGLQTHKQKEDTAVPGSRTAINISGVEADSIRRGDVVIHPGQYQPTRRLDVRFRLLKDATTNIRHNDEVKFFTGASQSIAVVRLLGTDELAPGSEGWVQLELREPVIAVRGDRYILRRPSPGETLGGGVIVDHQPKGRHKRFDEDVLRSLESLMRGSPADLLLEAALALGIVPIREVVARSRLDNNDAESALRDLTGSKTLLALEDDAITIDSESLVASETIWKSLRDAVLRSVEEYHTDFPLRRGIPREELKSKLKQSSRVFNAAMKYLVTEAYVTDAGNVIAKAGYVIKFNGQDQTRVDALMRRFQQNPFSPPGVKECENEVGGEILRALIESGDLIAVSADVIFRKTDYDSMKRNIQKMMEQSGQITLAEVRDLFGTSRKYAQALLEHFDATGFTMRDGDFRKLRK